MLRKLIKWLKSLFKKERIYDYEFVDDVPNRFKIRTIYIIGNEEYYWQIVMLCPCGCKKILHMNLMEDYAPYWRYEFDKRNRITLCPSVHRIVGCKSHFFIRKGTISWCK